MYFLVNEKKKIIFGWSAKCGCSHIKNIFRFLENGKMNNKIHEKKDCGKIPNNIEEYITIIITRNPYKRLISGFLDKYSEKGQYRYLWKDKILSFSKFVNELVKKDNKTIEKHHFTPQTTENFNKKILMSKIFKIYDISKIDYKFIEKIYNIKINPCVINRKFGHERDIKKNILEKYVYDLPIEDYINYNINYNFFYNKDLKKKVFEFYINDFNFFQEQGIDYLNEQL